MRIDGLEMVYGHNGKATAKIWVQCHSVEDVEEIIAWLKMAKDNMHTWAKIDAQARPKDEKS